MIFSPNLALTCHAFIFYFVIFFFGFVNTFFPVQKDAWYLTQARPY